MKYPICIVGAGPAGLTMAKNLRKHDLDFFILEKYSDTGGIWDMKNPGTPMYEAAHFISSKTLSGFPGFPMPDEYPDYPNQKQILDYIRSFAQKENLYPNIKFNEEVKFVEKTKDGFWQIKTNKNVYLADSVICATGGQWHANIPKLPGSFSGTIRHSQTFKKSEEFKNKKVLIVGGGNSAVDIACEAAVYADEVWLSMRRGYHFLPKHIFGQPADVFAHEGPKIPMFIQQKVFGWLLKLIVGDQTKYGLPKPDHKLFESHPLLNSQVIHHVTHGNLKVVGDLQNIENYTVFFNDGKRHEFDEIILATGYHFHIPYASQYFDWLNERPVTNLNVFNPKTDNIFTLGLLETNSAAYTLIDQLSGLIADYIVLQYDNPEKAKTVRNIIETEKFDIHGKLKLIDSARHTGYVEADAIQKSIKKIKKMLRP